MYLANKLTPEKLRLTPDNLRKVADELEKAEAPIGNGNAVFLEDMNEEEYERYEYEQKHGWGSFLKKLGLPIINNDDENNTDTDESLIEEVGGEENGEWLGDDTGSDSDSEATEGEGDSDR